MLKKFFNKKFTYMTNKQIIQKVNEGFAENDTEKIMQYVADDVRWDVMGASIAVGKDAFLREVNNEHFIGLPSIKIKNEIEQKDWVAVEGEVQCAKKDGGMLDAFFFDIYRLENGKIKEMRSYVIEKNKSFY
jgi:ketosteroid isomerase-like protein